MKILLQLRHREVDDDGTAVGTVALDVGVFEAGQKNAHLLHGERVAGSNRAVAGEGGGETVRPVRSDGFSDENVGDVAQGSGQITADEARRDRADGEGVRTELLDLETEARQGVGVLEQGGALPRGEWNDDRIEERLTWATGPEPLGQDLFVQNPLVPGVLVDEVHPARSLGDDVRILDLADGSEGGRAEGFVGAQRHSLPRSSDRGREWRNEGRDRRRFLGRALSRSAPFGRRGV